MIRWALVLMAVLSGPAFADSIRVGEHPHFGRVVLEFGERVAYEFSASGDHARLKFRDVLVMPGLPVPPRNVRSISASQDAIDFALTPGARVKVYRQGSRLILDVADPYRIAPLRPEGPAVAAPPAPVAAPSQAAAEPERAALVAASVAPVPVKEEAVALPAPSDTLAIAASRVPGAEPGILLPFPEYTGAAAFRRGDTALLVFDRLQPLDLASLKADPVFGSAVVQLLPAATLIQLTMPAGAMLRLERRPEGWVVRAGAVPAHEEPAFAQGAGQITIGLREAGQVVVVPDPETGSVLLVGTVLDGAGVTVPRRTPAVRILPSWLGLAVEPLSDQVHMQAQADGFILRAPDVSVAAVPAAALADAASLTRVFDFPVEPEAALDRRLQLAVTSAAVAPVRARFKPRVAVAQAMIALGLGPEAQAVLAVARADDPQAAGRSNAPALQAVAALLAGRLGEAGALDDSRFDGSDEITLWRAVLAAARGQFSPVAAAGFAATVPLIVAYPEALRARLLPIAAETMARGGQEEVADGLLARFPGDPSLAFAGALRLEAKHDTDAALAAYDALAAGHDRVARARAGIKGAELRLATGRLDVAAAADRLEAFVPSWRGDRREFELRMRVSELRSQAGQFRPALDLLRETKALFPSAGEAIAGRMGDVLLAVLAAGHGPGLKPLDLVAIAGDYADCIPNSAAGDRLSDMLADRLAALDLPGQAAPVLARLMLAAPSGTQRGQFGLRLARMRIESGDGKGALDALQQSEAGELAPELAALRGLARARAQSLVHDVTGALATLSALRTPAADEMRASLLEAARDWPGALAALGDLARQQIPAVGELSDAQQELVLRQASAALQAGDRSALEALRVADAVRIAGPRADLFRLLTAPPVETADDLPRAARDIALARQIPNGLHAMSAR